MEIYEQKENRTMWLGRRKESKFPKRFFLSLFRVSGLFRADD